MGDGRSQGKGPPLDLILEDASAEEDELCPSCNDMLWLRLIADYKNGICYVIYCASCGKPVETKWNKR
jgi:hypothetical protein